MINLDRISKSYGSAPVLRSVSLRVVPGEVVALIGPNGAGKSTTLRILAGIIRPDSGLATVNGNDSTGSIDARRSMGYLPQRLAVPPATTVMDLVRLVARIRGVGLQLAAAALEASGLGLRGSAPFSELSGGQKQRVMLMLATLGPITSLLLDEPSISLDADGSDEVRSVIRAARARGNAVLFASHHLADVAALADRVAVMVDGRIIAQGNLVELANQAGVPWIGSGEPPIERVYRALIAGYRAGIEPGQGPACQLVRGAA